MRLGLIVLTLLLASAAAAQTPQPEIKMTSPAYGVIGGPLVLEQVQKLPPDTAMTIVEGLQPTKLRDVTAADVLKLLQQGKEVREFRKGSTQAPSCPVDYSEINAEKKASDDRLRRMQRSGEIIPVLHQYEQEMYYEDRRNQLYEKICGKPREGDYWDRRPDMRQKACAALGAVCKPRKHW